MPKKLIVFSLIAISLLLYSGLLYADVVLLKSGGVMQGEIINISNKHIEFKNASGIVEKIRKSLVASFIKQKKLPLIPEEAYLKKVKVISVTDAKAHYELGVFCVKNSLFNYALKEFNQAKAIDSEYREKVIKYIKYIESVKEEVKNKIELEEKSEKKIQEALPLTLAKINQEFKKNELATPRSRKELELIVKAIHNFKESEVKQEYAEKYLELGAYLQKANMSRIFKNENKSSNIPLFCYEICYQCAQERQSKNLAEQMISTFRNKVRKKMEAKLIIPYSAFDRDSAILFIRAIEDKRKKSLYYGAYYEMAEVFNVKTGSRDMPLKEDERRNLEICLHSYQIIKSAYTKNILDSGIIDAKIRECQKRLEN